MSSHGRIEVVYGICCLAFSDSMSNDFIPGELPRSFEPDIPVPRCLLFDLALVDHSFLLPRFQRYDIEIELE